VSRRGVVERVLVGSAGLYLWQGQPRRCLSSPLQPSVWRHSDTRPATATSMQEPSRTGVHAGPQRGGEAPSGLRHEITRGDDLPLDDRPNGITGLAAAPDCIRFVAHVPAFRCDVEWPGPNVGSGSFGSSTLRRATLRGPHPVSSTCVLIGESRGRDLMSGSVREVGQAQQGDRG
jgi:hypothetical protein